METIRTNTVRTPLPTVLELPDVDLAWRYQSARVGGDFFDAMALKTRVTLLLTDISGLRAQAHPIAAGVQEVFRGCSQKIFGSGEGNESECLTALLQEVNRTLLSGSHGTHFAPTFLGCYNRQLSILTYINAGGLPPVFRDSDGTRVLESGGVPLGLFSHMTHEPGVQAFEPGARLLLMTKGLIQDSAGSSGKRIEPAMARMRKAFESSKETSARGMCEAILKEARELSKPGPFARLLGPKDAEDFTVVALFRHSTNA